MSDTILTEPIVLDETGQLILDKLDEIVSALNPNAQGVSFDKTGCEIITANNVQGALTQLDSGLDNTNTSLTHKQVVHDMTVTIPSNGNALVDVDISSAPSTQHIVEGFRASSGGAGQVVFSNVYFTDDNTISVRLLNLGANPTTTAMKLTIDYK